MAERNPSQQQQPSAVQDTMGVRAQDWLNVLLRGTDHECSGMPIAWSGTADDCVMPESRVVMSQITPHHVRANDVIVRAAGPSHAWVWIKTGYVGTDEAIGPLGLVKVDGSRGLLVRAVGTLRALRDVTDITLTPWSGHAVVTVFAQNCAPTDAKCRQEIRWLRIDGDGRLQPLMLHAAQKGCVGMARVDRWRQETTFLDLGKQHVGQSAVVETTPQWHHDGLILREKRTVRDESSGRVVRQSQAERILTWRDGVLQLP